MCSTFNASVFQIERRTTKHHQFLCVLKPNTAPMSTAFEQDCFSILCYMWCPRRKKVPLYSKDARMSFHCLKSGNLKIHFISFAPFLVIVLRLVISFTDRWGLCDYTMSVHILLPENFNVLQVQFCNRCNIAPALHQRER